VEAKVRNRIVGSVIILAAAVIILPSILDGEKRSYKDEFKTVPQRPEFETVQSDKSFPQTAFEQNMPDTEQVTDEQPLDADQMSTSTTQAEQNTATQQQSLPPAGSEVLSNETLTVSTISRPTNFDQPASAASQAPTDVQAQAKPKTNAQSQIKTPSKKIVTKPQQTAQTTANTTTKQQSPFTSSAWVIQIGSFGLKANANTIEKKLNDAGYTTFSRQIKSTSGKTLTKVYVGPQLSKTVLVKALPNVNKVANVKAIVTSFTIKR